MLAAAVAADDPAWGMVAVNNHRRLIAALRDRDTSAVIEHTEWQLSDGDEFETLDRSGIWR